MAEPAKIQQPPKTINSVAPDLKVTITMYPLDLTRDKFKKKNSDETYYKQPASISQGEGLPPIPHSFYVKKSDDAYQPGKYVAQIQIRSGKFGAEFDLGKPTLIKEPK